MDILQQMIEHLYLMIQHDTTYFFCLGRKWILGGSSSWQACRKRKRALYYYSGSHLYILVGHILVLLHKMGWALVWKMGLAIDSVRWCIWRVL